MSLKSYLREMVSAHLGSKKLWVAHQSAPSGTYISITVPNHGYNWTLYTPPSDGYITIVPGENCRYDIRASCNSTNWVEDKGWLSGTVPVRQGETVNLKTFSKAVTESPPGLTQFFFVPSVANE